MLTITALLFSSCKKDAAAHDPKEPVINVTAPAAQQVFEESDTIWIAVGIRSEDNLHEYSITVKNITENSTAYTYNGHTDEKSADVRTYFLPNIMRDADMELTVTTLDHNGVKSSKSMTFKVLNTIAAAKPVITLTSPDAGMYTNGTHLRISGTIVHLANLRSVRVTLEQNNMTVLDYTPDVTGKMTYTIDTAYQINVNGYAGYSLTVVAGDMNNQVESKSFDFHVHP